MRNARHILLLILLSLRGSYFSFAQTGSNDTIRLGVVNIKGEDYPMIFLDECTVVGAIMDEQAKLKLQRLRNDIYVVYPYALAAADMLKQIHTAEDGLPDRRARKHYLKSIDKELDRTFKTPLKNLTIDQGHVLIKLIDRQTGENCYDIIKEVKGRLAAMTWESVGVFFKNNLTRDYDPNGRDKEIERIVTELEVSNYYKYELMQQRAMMKQITKK